MEEVQRMAQSGEALAIWREWELKDQAVQWLLTGHNYVQVSADADDQYVLLLQVHRDLESLKCACVAGNEEIVVARSLVDAAKGGSAASAASDMLASFSYLECPMTEQSPEVAEQDDSRYFYRAVNCKLRLPASDSDSVVVQMQPVEAHRSSESVPQDWKDCCSLVMDTSRLPAHEQMSISGTAGDGAAVTQTPVIRFQLDAWARANEFHLDLKLKVKSLSVGVTKKEFKVTDTCLGFFPDWIRLSMEPCWVEEHMSEAIFENKQKITEVPQSSSAKITQNTEIGVAIGMGPASLSAKRSWGKEKNARDDDATNVIEYETEEGGVASVEWQICRWEDGKAYKSNRPLSPSLISGKKLPKLPFKGTTPQLKDFAALISLTAAAPFLKLPKHKKVPLEREFAPFVFQLPAALLAPDAVRLSGTNT